MKPIEITEDGYAEVALADANGGKVTLQVDVYRAFNRLCEVDRFMSDQPMSKRHQAIVDFLKELGFPECSHRVADQFGVAIAERVKELAEEGKKKEMCAASLSPTPASCASTAAASSA